MRVENEIIPSLFFGSKSLCAFTGPSSALRHGWVWIRIRHNRTSGGQLTASTTNASSWNQGFGIISGTSNCLEDNEIAVLHAQQKFITGNLSILSKQIARGEGDSIDGLATTLGCSSASFSHFAFVKQDSYNEIFSSAGALAVS